MKPNIHTYEKSVVFVQKISDSSPIMSFAKFVDLDYIVKNDILSFNVMENIGFDDANDDFSSTIKLPSINIKIMGTLDKLVISLIDAEDTDDNLKNTIESYSKFLNKEKISAIGYNRKFIHEFPDFESLFKEKIISNCPPIISNSDSVGFKMKYELEDASFNVSLDTGKLNNYKSGEKKGIIIGYNYHQDIKHKNVLKSKIEEFINSLGEIENKFVEKDFEIESYLYE